MFGKILGKVKKNKGFTLIELIVVIAIIAILALILIPRFGGFRESAQNTADDATARTINSAVSTLIVTGDIEVGAGGTPSFTIGSGTVVSANPVGITVRDPDPAAAGTPASDLTTHLQRLLGTGVQGSFEVDIDGSGNITVDPV